MKESSPASTGRLLRKLHLRRTRSVHVLKLRAGLEWRCTHPEGIKSCQHWETTMKATLPLKTSPPLKTRAQLQHVHTTNHPQLIKTISAMPMLDKRPSLPTS
eukprot:316362-Rhodomonas_salina.1